MPSRCSGGNAPSVTGRRLLFPCTDTSTRGTSNAHARARQAAVTPPCQVGWYEPRLSDDLGPRNADRRQESPYVHTPVPPLRASPGRQGSKAEPARETGRLRERPEER